MIPRYIHQIFLTGALPSRLEDHVADLKARNPAWTHRLYNDEICQQFIATHYGDEMLDAYQRINTDYGAARADLMRHLIIFKLGGVYLDIKSDLVKPLDEVLRPDDEYILTQWRNAPGEPHEGFGLHPELSHVPGGEYQTHHIISAAGHPFTEAAIALIVQNIRGYRPWSGVGKMGVIRTTGPSAYTLAIQPLRARAPHRVATTEELGIVFSIADYQHRNVFKRHYSTLKSPLVRLPLWGRIMQKGFERMRSFRSALSLSVKTYD